MKSKEIMVLFGPTAVGKTEISLGVAKSLGGEILSADSMQIYQWMDIGSAKPTPEEQLVVPHHLVDEIDPRYPFSVADYQKKAKEAIENMFSRGKLPIVSGGTGLYINSLIYDMDFGKNQGDSDFRKKMEKFALEKGNEELHDLLMAKDPKAGRQIHPNNVKKVIRALERWETEGEIKLFRDNLRPTKDYKVLMIGLKRNRDQLYHRIEKRVDGFIQAGLVEEVEKLLGRGLSPKDISMKGIGYKEIIPFLEGKVSLEEAREEIKKNTRNLAKRQMTWFRSYSDVKWFDLSEIDHPVEEMIQWWKNR